MFADEYMASANGAKAKVTMLKTNPTGYFMLAMLAGSYIGIGIMLAFTVGGTLAAFPFGKVAMGIAFGVALSLVFIAADGATGATGKALTGAAIAKAGGGPVALFAKGMLCNFLVCLAVWCGFRTKDDTAKLIMIFWCLFAFFTSGFEHSIANMTVLTIGLLSPVGQGITMGGYLYNLIIVTAGNILGALLFMTVPYGLAAKK